METGQERRRDASRPSFGVKPNLSKTTGIRQTKLIRCVEEMRWHASWVDDGGHDLAGKTFTRYGVCSSSDGQEKSNL